eukprot:TRINITY_DN55951_c0_g1_i1.p1 TRINITY_DN55951_c0_g1~~TRINITY_DN55951_c0_g1_i1.p1  ORF type:complete len:562 (+),score=45.26 TRINITY_DN55951_c0_g1_i1:36-1721(+)
MCDDPYYFRDGKSSLLTEEVRPNHDFLSTMNGPVKGKALVIPGKKGRLLTHDEKMDWDPNIPLTDKINKLGRRFPYVPLHTLSILVHDSPDWSADQLAQVLQHLGTDGEVAVNCERVLPPPPTELSPLEPQQPKSSIKKRGNRVQHDDAKPAPKTTKRKPVGTTGPAPNKPTTTPLTDEPPPSSSQASIIVASAPLQPLPTEEQDSCKEVWICETCTLENNKQDTTCAACGSQNQTMATPNPSFPPNSCTPSSDDVPATVTTTTVTKKTRKTKKKASPPTDSAVQFPVTWTCSYCTLVNQIDTETCVVCQQTRETNFKTKVSQRGYGRNGMGGLYKETKTEVNSFPFNYVPLIKASEELQPGLVVMRGALDLQTQQWVANESFRIATNPDGRSGGFYRVMPNGDVALNEGHRGSFAENISSFAPQLSEVCRHFLGYARELSPAVPHMNGKWLGMKFYDEKSHGLLWHRDGDDGWNSRGEKLQPSGRPVVSFTIGDGCDFRWKNRKEDPDNILELRSGDIVVFGGPSRNILHAVTKIHAGSTPRGLKIKKGRLNLTYRHGGD